MIRVLVVSPDPADHVMLQKLLAPGHWSIDRASSVSDALACGGANRPDLVLTEEQLPDGKWFALIDFFSEQKIPPPIIVMSRNTDGRLWGEVLNLGGLDVLTKPLVAIETLRVLALALDYGAIQFMAHGAALEAEA